MPKLTTKYKSALELADQLGFGASTVREGLYLQRDVLPTLTASRIARASNFATRRFPVSFGIT